MGQIFSAVHRAHHREGAYPPTVVHVTVYRLAFGWQIRYVGRPVEVPSASRLDWSTLPTRDKEHGEDSIDLGHEPDHLQPDQDATSWALK